MKSVWKIRGQVVTSTELKKRTRLERDAIREELYEENKVQGIPISNKLRVLRSWKNDERGSI